MMSRFILGFLLLLVLYFTPSAYCKADNLIVGTEVPVIEKVDEKCECYIFDKYVVLSKSLDETVGEDIIVIKREKGLDNKQLCQKEQENIYFYIKSELHQLLVTYFFGLSGKFLFVDIGTGPNPRGLTIYNLEQKEKIYEAGYFDPVRLINREDLVFGKYIDRPKEFYKNCPQRRKYLSWGGSIGWKQRVRLNLNTLQEVSIGKLRCVYMQ